MTARHVTIHGDHWAKIPEALIYSEASGNAVKVYGAFMRHGSDPANCYPSYGRLAELCHLGERTVRRATNELVDGGWVEIEHRYDDDGRQTSNGYHVHLSPELTGGGDTPDQGEGEGDTRDQEEGDTRDQGRGTPVADEREPLNESHKNERAPKSSSNLRARAKSADDDDGATADLKCALGAIGLDYPTPTTQETRYWQRALSKGWTAVQLTDKADEVYATANRPRPYLLTCLQEMANNHPDDVRSGWHGDVKPISSDLGMSPPVPSTPESRAAEEAEYWARVGQTGYMVSASSAVGYIR